MTAADDQRVVIDPAHRMLAWTVNRVTSTPDPTAHLEVEAIRAAARETALPDVSGRSPVGASGPRRVCRGAGRRP